MAIATKGPKCFCPFLTRKVLQPLHFGYSFLYLFGNFSIFLLGWGDQNSTQKLYSEVTLLTIFCRLREFELLLISYGITEGFLSKIYGILLKLTGVEETFRTYWERDLGSAISEVDWQQISKRGYQTSLNIPFMRIVIKCNIDGILLHTKNEQNVSNSE